MKTIKFILIILLWIPYIGKAQTIENIFTIQSGKVIPKSSLVDPLDPHNTPTTQVLVSTEKVLSKDATLEYEVSLYNYNEDILGGFPGLFRLVQIKKGGKELLKLYWENAWDTIPKQFTNGTVKNFMKISLTEKMTALLFVGYTYPDDPGVFTIVILNGEEATLVYNKNMYPIEIINNPTGFSTYIANGFVQYLSGDDNNISKIDTETLPYKYHIWSENGLLKIQNLGKITKSFLE